MVFDAKFVTHGNLWVSSPLFSSMNDIQTQEWIQNKGLILQKTRQMLRKSTGLIDFPLNKDISNSPLLWYDITMSFVLGRLWIVFSFSYNSKSRFSYWDSTDKLFSLEAQCSHKKLQNCYLPPTSNNSDSFFWFIIWLLHCFCLILLDQYG